jgi:endonuclease YncB( thermonuclease family)
MKKQIAIAITIALVVIAVIFTASVLSEDVNKPNVIICAFDQNPAGVDRGNEWVLLYNPTNDTIDLCNWKLTTKHSGGKTVTISEEAKLIPEEEGTNIAPHGYRFVTCSTGFLRNENESVTLIDPSGNEIDSTCNSVDTEGKYHGGTNRYCMRDQNTLDTDSDTDWIFQTQMLEKWKIRNGEVVYVEDGDTIDVSPVEGAYIQRIRLVGVNTPERDEPGYNEAKEFVKEMCLGKEVSFDVDDCKPYDEYHRILAVVYVNGTNLNAELLKGGYAEILYIPPSEFNPHG